MSVPSQYIIGLMSGTSVDGVDAALVRLSGAGLELSWALVDFTSVPYPERLREKILRACRPETSDVRMICELNFEVGFQFAEAAKAVTWQAGCTLDEIALIGSHGQTVYHQPPSARLGVPSTFQIGESAVIAQETGVPVVSDFRTADMALGGEGAPLVPYVDFLLFRAPGTRRALQNLGGIGNVTYLPERAEDVRAFDTGPGNMLLDGVMCHLTGGSMDRDGRLASSGRVDQAWFAELMEHPFLRQPPPKSTGREMFGEAYVKHLLQRISERRLTPSDAMATLTEFTAASVRISYERFLPAMPDQVFVSGGGVHNCTLIDCIQQQLDPISVHLTDELGCPVDAKEAIAFALLAHEMIAGHPANLPAVTGARHSALLGKLTPGTRGLKFGPILTDESRVERSGMVHLRRETG